MNFGTIYVDFYEPLRLSEVVKESQKIMPGINPYTKKEDRMKVNNHLG